MKKNMLFTAALAFVFVGCNKDLVPEVPSNSDNIEINETPATPDEPYYAEVVFQSEIVGNPDPDTKATLGAPVNDSHPVSWTVGDKVWLWRQAMAGAQFTAMESTRTSSFVNRKWATQSDYNNFYGFSDSQNGYYAISPFIPANYNPKGSWAYYWNNDPTSGFAVMNIPDVQYAVENGCDPDAMVMTAMTRGKDYALQFHNGVAMLEFALDVPAGYSVQSVVVSVDAYEASKIKLSLDPDYEQTYSRLKADFAPGENDEYTAGEIAGKRLVFAPDATSWENKTFLDGIKHAVTLKNRDESPLKDGATYYIAVWPGQKTGFTLTVNATDSKGNSVTWSRSSSGEHVFLKGVVYPLGEIEPVF